MPVKFTNLLPLFFNFIFTIDLKNLSIQTDQLLVIRSQYLRIAIVFTKLLEECVICFCMT